MGSGQKRLGKEKEPYMNCNNEMSTLVLEQLRRVIDQFLLHTAVKKIQGVDIVDFKHSIEMISFTLLGFDSCCMFWSQNHCSLTQS